MSFKILRVSSLPTERHPGSGIAAVELSKMEGAATTHLSYLQPGDNLSQEAIGLNTVLLPFPNPVMPEQRRGLRFFVLQLIRLFVIIRFSFHAISIVRKGDFDVVHIHSPMFFMIGLYAHLRSIPTFLTFHGTDFYRVESSALYRALLRWVPYICTVSSQHLDPLEKFFKSATILLASNGIDVSSFSIADIQRKKRIILAVGTLRWHKGFQGLIGICSDLFRSIDDWILLIVGDGEERESLERIIDENAMSHRIKLMGLRSRREIVDYFADAGIFALSSKTEGLPKVLLEAMSSNCACVTYDVGDCARVLGEAGMVAEAGNDHQFKNFLRSYMSDRNLREQSGRKARERSMEFTWKSYIENHRKWYVDAMNPK